jgi:hypothetical protein
MSELFLRQAKTLPQGLDQRYVLPVPHGHPLRISYFDAIAPRSPTI